MCRCERTFVPAVLGLDLGLAWEALHSCQDVSGVLSCNSVHLPFCVFFAFSVGCLGTWILSAHLACPDARQVCIRAQPDALGVHQVVWAVHVLVSSPAQLLRDQHTGKGSTLHMGCVPCLPVLAAGTVGWELPVVSARQSNKLFYGPARHAQVLTASHWLCGCLNGELCWQPNKAFESIDWGDGASDMEDLGCLGLHAASQTALLA